MTVLFFRSIPIQANELAGGHDVHCGTSSMTDVLPRIQRCAGMDGRSDCRRSRFGRIAWLAQSGGGRSHTHVSARSSSCRASQDGYGRGPPEYNVALQDRDNAKLDCKRTARRPQVSQEQLMMRSVCHKAPRTQPVEPHVYLPEPWRHPAGLALCQASFLKSIANLAAAYQNRQIAGSSWRYKSRTRPQRGLT